MKHLRWLVLVTTLSTLARAWWVAYDPAGLPAWDSAGYLHQAVKLRAHLAALDLGGLSHELLRADLHPPLHGLLLGTWLLPWEDTLLGARVYALVCFAGATGLLALLGAESAALLGLCGAGMLALVSTPMTESTTLLALYGTLWLAWRAPVGDTRAALGLGLAIFGASLVRYNLGPMLLAPVAAHLVLRGERSWRLLLLGLPALGGFGAWQLLRPTLATQVQKFLENRSSGLDFWSVENLGWVPLTLGERYLPWALVVLVLGLFAWGSRRVRAPDGVFVLYGWLTILLLTLHDFKVDRNLGVALPVLWLVALRGRAWAPALALVFAAWQHVAVVPGLAAKGDVRPNPVARRVLELVAEEAGAGGTVWVVGTVYRISPDLLGWWLLDRAAPARLRVEQPSFGERSRERVSPDWSEAYADYVADTMLTTTDTAIVTIEVPHESPFRDPWRAFGNNYARAMAEQRAWPEVRQEDLGDVVVRVYRPAAAPRVEHPLEGWRWIGPGDGPSPGTLSSDGHVVVPAPVGALQACGPDLPAGRVSVRLTHRVEGRAWVHLRVLGADGKPLKRPDGTAEILMVGPLTGEGRVSETRGDKLPEGAAGLRPCLVLNNVSGELEVGAVVTVEATGAAR